MYKSIKSLVLRELHAIDSSYLRRPPLFRGKTVEEIKVQKTFSNFFKLFSNGRLSRDYTETLNVILSAFPKAAKTCMFQRPLDLLKRAYDRNFPRDQLFCDFRKLRCNESSFFGHIIVICLLVLLRKFNQTESPKTVQLLRIFQKNY